MQCAVVIPAAGSGRRLGSEKQFADINGRAVLWHCVAAFMQFGWVAQVVVVVAAAAEAQAREVLKEWLGERCAVYPLGAATRAGSVCGGLQQCPPVQWCMVHDGARPCVSPDDIEKLWAARPATSGDDNNGDGAILATPAADALKKINEKTSISELMIEEHLTPRQCYYQAQTPQLFPLAALRAALPRFADAADEAEAMSAAGHAVRVIEGSRNNIKITYPDDLIIAESILKNNNK